MESGGGEGHERALRIESEDVQEWSKLLWGAADHPMHKWGKRL